MKSLSCLAVLLGVSVVATTAEALPLTYRLVDLGSSGEVFSRAYDINDSSQIIGVTAGDISVRSFVANGVSKTQIGTLGGSSSSVIGINNAGALVGSSMLVGDSAVRAFISSNGVMKDLGTLGGTHSFASGINNSGLISGYSFVQNDGALHAVVYEGAALKDLGTLGGLHSAALAINDAGWVTGDSHIAGSGEAHAFLYDGSAMRDLGTFGGSYSGGFSINSAGAVTGYSITSANQMRAFLYQGNDLVDLGSLDEGQSQGLGINDSGVIVGTSSARDEKGRWHGFIYTGSAMYDLNDLVDGGVEDGWLIQEARSINNAGQIVGTAIFEGRERAFLLIPLVVATVPEPSSLVLTVVALLVLINVRRSCKRRNLFNGEA